MSRGRIIAAVVALVVIAAIVVIIMVSAQARVPQVSVATVQKENLTQTVTASGQLEGDVKADVFPPTQSTLTSILVVDGQQVKAGQVLANIDREPLDVQVEQTLAALKQAESALVQARRSAPSSAQINQANQAVSSANAALANAQDSLDIASQQLTQAKRQLGTDERALAAAQASGNAAAIQAAEGTVRQDKATINQLEASIPQAKSGVAQAKSGVAQAKAGRDALKSQSAAIAAAEAGVNSAQEAYELALQTRDKAALVAPIDGVVVFAGSNAGGAVAGGSAALAAAGGGGGKPAVGAAVSPASAPFTVFQLGALNFNAQVDEADISNVAVGMKGTVTLDAFPGVNFDTTVVQVKTQAIQTSTGGTAFPVLLSLRNTGKRLLVGMGGNVDIDVSGINDAVTVPVEALFDESGGTFVYVVDKSNVVHRRKVTTGVMTDTRAQIVSGVVPGEKVALGGLSSLKDGQTVRVK